MRDMGFTNIDAVDCSPGMLKIARSKNIYKNIIEDVLGSKKLDVEDSKSTFHWSK